MPRIEQIERMRGFDHLLIGRQNQFVLQQPPAGGFMGVELHRQHGGVGLVEVIDRLLDLVLKKHVAVGDRAEWALRPNDVEDAFLALDIHPETFEAVGDFAHHRPAVEPAHLLEVGELRNLHAVEPHSHPNPHAPSVGDSQLSSTNRMSCVSRSKPSERRESRYSS